MTEGNAPRATGGRTRLYIALVHYPVYDKNNQPIASAITTLDLHDMARLARTFDVKRFFAVNPLRDQQTLAERVKRHWTEGYGARYNRHRCDAMRLLHVVPELGEAFNCIVDLEGEPPLLLATDAHPQMGRLISFPKARGIIETGKTVLILFGTAWGLGTTVMEKAEFVLEPIPGRDGYNHLSVRTAAAIILDRLVGSN